MKRSDEIGPELAWTGEKLGDAIGAPPAEHCHQVKQDMNDIGIFFGTDSGTTRLIAKKIAKGLNRRLGAGAVAKPLNVNRATPADLAAFPVLLLGTPTYGEGELPGKAAGTEQESWSEFLPLLAGKDFSGVIVGLFGCGDQETYPRHFADGLGQLYDFFAAAGAILVGDWDTEGYAFEGSKAVRDGRFVGLVVDQHLQHLLTDARIAAWLDDLVPRIADAAPPMAAVG